MCGNSGNAVSARCPGAGAVVQGLRQKPTVSHFAATVLPRQTLKTLESGTDEALFSASKIGLDINKHWNALSPPCRALLVDILDGANPSRQRAYGKHDPCLIRIQRLGAIRTSLRELLSAIRDSENDSADFSTRERCTCERG